MKRIRACFVALFRASRISLLLIWGGAVSGLRVLPILLGVGLPFLNLAGEGGRLLGQTVIEVTSGAQSETYSGDMSLSKLTDGTYTLNRANTYTGGTTISGGTLEITNIGALGTGAVTIGTGTKLKVSTTGELAKTITGTGTLEYAATSNSGTVLTLTGDLSGFSGTITRTGGYAIVFNTASSLSKTTVVGNWQEICFVDRGSAVDATVGMIIGNGILRPSTTGGTSIVVAVGNDADNSSANHTFSGTVQDQKHNNTTLYTLGINKVGSNTWTLSGNNNSYTGATNVLEGVLELASGGRVTASSITVHDGGTLKNAGTIAQRVTVAEGGTYASAGGTLTNGLTLEAGGILTGDYSGANITLQSGAVLKFDLDDLQAMDLTGAAFGDSLVVSLWADDAEALYGKSFDLFTTNESQILEMVSLNTANAPGYVNWIASYLDGTFRILAGNPASTPEPGSWALLLFGCLYLFRRPIRRSPWGHL
ncbi:MAG: autotransporter-associated beta strand repeat-containing protein [Planctomycetia bacterium]|nr:autotransporter-associated beta strand repeat-containing protein [Planctomycetia bacterium]